MILDKQQDELLMKRIYSGSNMVFIASGMGGGTGTARHVIRLREMNILTVGWLRSFAWGPKRMRRAIAGLEGKKHLDLL